jgi:hypothetical protein
MAPAMAAIFEHASGGGWPSRNPRHLEVKTQNLGSWFTGLRKACIVQGIVKPDNIFVNKDEG